MVNVVDVFNNSQVLMLYVRLSVHSPYHVLNKFDRDYQRSAMINKFHKKCINKKKHTSFNTIKTTIL